MKVVLPNQVMRLIFCLSYHLLLFLFCSKAATSAWRLPPHISGRKDGDRPKVLGGGAFDKRCRVSSTVPENPAGCSL